MIIGKLKIADWRTKEWLTEYYIVKQLSFAQIGGLVGRSGRAVAIATSEFGIEHRSSSQQQLLAHKEITKEILDQLYNKDLLSTQKIADRFKVSQLLIINRLKLYNIKIRSRTESNRIHHDTKPNRMRLGNWATKDWLEKAYTTKSISEIAQEAGWSARSIRAKMKYFGILSRDTSSAITLKWNSEWRSQTERSLEYREKMASTSRAKWNDPEYREKMATALKAKWNNPEYRKKMIDVGRSNWDNKEYRYKMLQLYASPEYKAKIAKMRSDPEYCRMMSEIYASSEFRQKLISSGKARWLNPEYREHMAEVRRNQPKVSSQQEILYSILTDLGVKYYREYNDRPDDIECSIGYYSADCVIPRGKNKPALVIECQGDYWHLLPKRVAIDKAKATHIGNLPDQYELKYFWEHEFLCKDKIVGTLKYWLGLDKISIIDYDLNDLKIRLIPTKDCKLLLGKYHYLPNAGRGGIVYGAYLGDELIVVCVFSPMVRQNIDTLEYNPKESRELSRLCIHPKYRQKNLASYFVSRCLKLLDVKYKLVISYCDTTFNHNGAIYKACNFEEAGSVPPDYWYVDNAGYIMFKRTLYSHAVNLKLTESEFAEKYGYNKVWGLEKLKFVFRR